AMALVGVSPVGRITAAPTRHEAPSAGVDDPTSTQQKTPTAAVGVEEENQEPGRRYLAPPLKPPMPPLPPRIPPIPRIMSIMPPIMPIMPMPIEFSRFLVELAISCR